MTTRCRNLVMHTWRYVSIFIIIVVVGLGFRELVGGGVDMACAGLKSSDLFSCIILVRTLVEALATLVLSLTLVM